MSRLLAAQRALTTPSWVKNDLSRKAQANPSLDLRFADNKSLTDATTGQNLVTFTRASSGTYVDSQGVIKTATTNLLLQSEDLSSGTWSKSAGVTTTLDTSQGIPFTGANVYRVDYSGAAISLSQTLTYVAAQYSAFIWIKGIAGETIRFAAQSGVDANNYTLTGGWQRLTTTWTATAGSAGFSLNTSSGATARTIYVAAPQLEQSSTVGEYVKTISTINSAPRFDHNPTTGESLGLLVEEQRTNLAIQSADFTDASWVKTDCTITANESTAPDGTLTADLWTNTASPGIINNSITKDTTIRTYTASLWVKGTTTQFTITIDNGGPANRGRAQFNLTTNTVTGVFNDGGFTGTTATITPYLDGWVRVTLTTTTGTGTTIRLRPFFSNVGATVRIWGAQVEEGAFSTSYIPTTTATATRSADVASITGSNFGVSRTNLLLQSNGFDTTWTNSLTTETPYSGAAPDGTNTAWELKDSVDAVASQHLLSQTPANFVSGTAYTFSVWAKSGTLSHIALAFPSSAFGGTLTSRYSLATGTAVSIAAGTTATVTAFPNGWYRVTTTATATASASGALNIRLALAGTTSYQGDGTGTILIWGSQLETGSTATAYIPTTSAAVTVVDSPWYRQDEGTNLIEFRETDRTGTRTPRSLSDGTASNRIDAFLSSSLTANNRLVLAGVSYNPGNLTLSAAGTVNRHVISAAPGSAIAVVNGTLSTESAPPSLPVVNRIFIGADSIGGTPFTGTIRRLTYWPARLPNNVLQSITQ